MTRLGSGPDLPRPVACRRAATGRVDAGPAVLAPPPQSHVTQRLLPTPLELGRRSEQLVDGLGCSGSELDDLDLSHAPAEQGGGARAADKPVAFLHSELDDLDLSHARAEQGGGARAADKPVAVDIPHPWPECVVLMELLLHKGHLDPSIFSRVGPPKDSNLIRDRQELRRADRRLLTSDVDSMPH